MKTKFILSLTLLLCAGFFLSFNSNQAYADNNEDDAFTKFIKNQGDWIIRGRATGTYAHEKETFTHGVLKGNFDISHQLSGDFGLTYFLDDRLAVEFLTSYTVHELKLKNTAIGSLNLGEFTIVQMMAYMQYHFDPMGGADISPYVGAGAGYWFLFDENDSVDSTNLDLDRTFATGIEFGADVPITDNIAFNLDAKKYWVDTDVLSRGPNITADLELNPIIVGFGLGYKF